MKFNEISNWNLQFSKRIIRANQHNGFISAVIEAERGYGKSMYALKNMAYAYHILLECDENEAYKHALDSMIFSPKELIDRVKTNSAKDRVSIVWCIDDATVHFSSYLHFLNLYEAALLNGMFDTIRTSVSSLILTCPNKKRLLSSLKNYDDHTIQITKDRGYERFARGIKWFTIPDGTRRYRKVFEDEFSCYVPNWIYKLYIVKRKKYLVEISEKLEALQAKMERKRLKTNIPMST